MSEPGAIRRMPRTGTVAPFMGGEIPAGWLLCNGAEVSRSEYRRLYDAIGKYVGAGDGSTTFSLPDMRDKVVQGVGTNSLGDDIEASLPEISGGWRLSGHMMRGSKSNEPDRILSLSGAFEAFTVSGELSQGETTDPQEGEGVTVGTRFYASSSNSVYSGATVQPEALASNYVIRC